MTKTKYGVNPAFYAILAFILAYFQNITWLMVLIVFLIAAEQNEWAARQSIQAFGVSLIFWVIDTVLSKVHYFFADLAYKMEYKMEVGGKIFEVFGKLVSGLQGLVGLILLAVVIFGIVKAAKGKELNFPLFNKFANWVYGKTAPKKAAAPAQPQQPQQ